MLSFFSLPTQVSHPVLLEEKKRSTKKFLGNEWTNKKKDIQFLLLLLLINEKNQTFSFLFFPRFLEELLFFCVATG